MTGREWETVVMPTLSARAFSVKYRGDSIKGTMETMDMPRGLWRKPAKTVLLRELSEKRGLDPVTLKREAVVTWSAPK